MSRFVARSVLLSIAIVIAGCGDGGASKKKSSSSGGSTSPGGGSETPAAQPVKIDPATVATVKGVISFNGEAPKRPRIQMAADPFCATANPDPVLAETVVVNDAGRLRDVVVFVSKGVDGMKFPTTSDAVVLNQKGCQYEPHVFTVMAGQPIDIRNSDKTLHNIHAMPQKNAPFNFGQPRENMSRIQKFSLPELGIRIKCDVHPWMSSFAYVFNHPFHAVTEADGSFALSGLPPGDYTITAQHEMLGAKTQDVTLGASETKEINFTFGD